MDSLEALKTAVSGETGQETKGHSLARPRKMQTAGAGAEAWESGV